MERLRHAWIRVPLGRWLAAASEHGLCLLLLRDEDAPARLEAWRARWLPAARSLRDEASLAPVRAQLEAYAAGERRAFDLALDLRGSPFQGRVWRELCAIPYGATRTYGELATSLARPGGARNVGAAAGANPVPIVVPCHRLVGRRGLVGFGGGLSLKERLLAHEGVLLPL